MQGEGKGGTAWIEKQCMSFYCSDTVRYNEFAGSNLLVVRIDS